MTEHQQFPKLIDRYGRQVTYVRMSITDRCDFRCVYCMYENMNCPTISLIGLDDVTKKCWGC